jgi:hypothetical protein
LRKKFVLGPRPIAALWPIQTPLAFFDPCTSPVARVMKKVRRLVFMKNPIEGKPENLTSTKGLESWRLKTSTSGEASCLKSGRGKK